MGTLVLTENLFSNLEFHRSGIGLLPDPHEPDPGLAVHLAQVAGSQRPLTFCSCNAGRRSTCHHLDELSKQLEVVQQEMPGNWSESFAASPWLLLAQLFHEAGPVHYQAVKVRQESADGALRLVDLEGQEVLRYVVRSPATIRLLERLGMTPKGAGFSDRAGLLERLGTFLRSPEEQHLNKAGMRTNRQSFEDSFWWRLAYHGFREFNSHGHWRPVVDLRSGSLVVEFYGETGEQAASPSGTPKSNVDATLQVFAPRAKTKDLLLMLKRWGMSPSPLLSSDLFHSSPSTVMDESLRSKIDLLIAYGEEALDEPGDRDHFRYED